MSFVELTTDARGVARLTLNRPDKHNALNPAMVSELRQAIEHAGNDERVRVIVLSGAGSTFCAGADISHMRAMLSADEQTNLSDAHSLAETFRALDECPRPVIARIQGNAFGGALGLIAAADIAIASSTVRLALTEVRLGIIPATISPFVIRAIGEREARRLFLIGDAFDANEARRIGLVHGVAEPEQIDAEVERNVTSLLKGGPNAQRACKELIRAVAREAINAGLSERTAAMLARIRISSEGQEGLTAALEKRAPSWIPSDQH